jgi:hypothetical protein
MVALKHAGSVNPQLNVLYSEVRAARDRILTFEGCY